MLFILQNLVVRCLLYDSTLACRHGVVLRRTQPRYRSVQPLSLRQKPNLMKNFVILNILEVFLYFPFSVTMKLNESTKLELFNKFMWHYPKTSRTKTEEYIETWHIAASKGKMHREMMFIGAVQAGSDPATDRGRPSITWAFPD